MGPAPVAYLGLGLRRYLMINEYTAVIKKKGKWWVGWIEEVQGVNCQEPSRDKLIETLRAALKEAFGFKKGTFLFGIDEK